MTRYKTGPQIAKIIEETNKKLVKKYRKEISKEETSETIKYYKHAVSKGQIKFRHYFRDIIRKEAFKKEVGRMRLKYKIPKEGFNDIYNFDTLQDNILNKKELTNYYRDIKKIADSFGLYTHYWRNVVDEFVWFNKEEGLHRDFMHLDACFLESFYGFDTIISPCLEKYHNNKEESAGINKMYPVTLRISPDASIKEIIDYVNKFSSEIKTEQEKYKNENYAKISKVRYRSTKKQKRNDFIYANQHLSIKKTRKLVFEKFKESLDDGHIGKILSIERNKRKQV